MSEARRLAEPMKAQRFDGYRVHLPIVTVRIERNNVVARPAQALVDSGAAWTLAHMDIARSLGLDLEEVRRSTERVTFAGAAGAKRLAWGVRVRMIVGGSPRSRIELDDTLVFFTDAPLASFDLLLGQVGFFDRLTFVQLAQAPTPRFILEIPPR